jgi:O-antigen/teichoic acid export membrane protein
MATGIARDRRPMTAGRPRSPLSRLLPGSQFGRRVAVMGSGAILNQVLQAATIPFIGRLYGPSVFGEWALLQSIAAIIATVAGLRYELAVVIAGDGEEAIGAAAVQMYCSLLAACLALLIILFFRASIAAAVKSAALANWLAAAPLVGFLTATGLLATNCLVRKKRFRSLATMSLSQSGVMAGFQIAGAFVFRRGVAGLILGGIIGQLVPVAVILGMARARFRRLAGQALSCGALWKAARKHAAFPRYMAPWSLISALRERGVVILLGMFTTSRIVGYYSLALRLVWAPQGLATSSLNTVIFQRATEEEDISRLAPLVSGILMKMVALGAPAFVYLVWWSGDVLAAVLGEQWRGAGVYVAILCAPALTFLLQAWLDRLLAVVGGQRVGFLVEAVYTLIGLGLFGGSLALFGNAPLALEVFAAITVLYNVIFLVVYFRMCRFPYAELLRVAVRTACLAAASAALLAGASALLTRRLAFTADAAILLVWYAALACSWTRSARTTPAHSAILP